LTAKTRANLITEFQTGDVPDGSDYQDLIDSALNLTDSSAQTMTSKLTISGGLETTNVTAQRVYSSAMNLSGGLTVGSTVSANSINVNNLEIVKNCSASSMYVNATASFAGPAQFANMGIGSAAPAEGLRIAVSGDNNLHLHIATTVVASAGVSGPATPASVAGFIPVVINGVKRMIAFYNAG
jgi:hypothetical protein